jgi:hypothetical protein
MSSRSVTLDQALFASVRSAKNEGYQLVARSDGIDDALTREISAWAPTHDSLPEGDRELECVSLHVLDDGRWCLALTRSSGIEYSGRGRNVATWMLIADSLAIDAFAAQPFRLLDAAAMLPWPGWEVESPGAVPQLELLAGRSRLNLQAVSLACTRYGAAAVASAVDAVLVASGPLAILAERNRRQLLDALLSLLPYDRCLNLSFTAGLACSPRRPFALHVVSGEDQLRSFRRTFKGDVLDLRSPVAATLQSSYASELHQLLRTEMWSQLARCARMGSTKDE